MIWAVLFGTGIWNASEVGRGKQSQKYVDGFENREEQKDHKDLIRTKKDNNEELEGWNRIFRSERNISQMEILEAELWESIQTLDVLSSRREGDTLQSSGLEALMFEPSREIGYILRSFAISLDASNHCSGVSRQCTPHHLR